MEYSLIPENLSDHPMDSRKVQVQHESRFQRLLGERHSKGLIVLEKQTETSSGSNVFA